MREAEILLRPPNLFEEQPQFHHVPKLKAIDSVSLMGQGGVKFQRSFLKRAERKRDYGCVRLQIFGDAISLECEFHMSAPPLQKPPFCTVQQNASARSHVRDKMPDQSAVALFQTRLFAAAGSFRCKLGSPQSMRAD